MRDRYNALVESTVSLNKYNKLTDKYNKKQNEEIPKPKIEIS